MIKPSTIYNIWRGGGADQVQDRGGIKMPAQDLVGGVGGRRGVKKA